MKEVARLLNDLMESESVTVEAIVKLADAHGLNEAWEDFRRKFLDD